MVIVMATNFKHRVSRLETSSGFGEVRFLLRNGQRVGIPGKQILAACNEAIDGGGTRRAQILLNAERASDGSTLHNLCQAIAAGPVAPGEVNDGQF
jgi:hypothetical protein